MIIKNDFLNQFYLPKIVIKKAPPAVLTNLKDTNVLEGSKLELFTQLSDCYPIPTVQWLKDETNVIEDAEHLIETNNSILKYVIKNASQQDEGKYCLKAFNDLGSVETSCQANVNGKLFFPTEFRLRFKNHFFNFKWCLYF